MIWCVLIDPAWSGRLCLTLLHSVWQVALVAIIAWCVDRLWRNQSVERRYVVFVAAMIAVLAAMPITYLVMGVAERPTVAVARIVQPATALEHKSVSVATTSLEATGNATAGELTTAPLEFSSQNVQTAASDSPAIIHPSVSPSRPWGNFAPWLAAFYIAGVVLMLARLMLALRKASRLVAHAEILTDGPLVEALRSLAEKWGARVNPALARSRQIAVPTLVGFARPTTFGLASTLRAFCVATGFLCLPLKRVKPPKRLTWDH